MGFSSQHVHALIVQVEIKLEDVPDDDTESTPYATPRVPNMHDISSPPATPTATPQPVALGDSTDAVRTPAVISKRASSDSRVQATGEVYEPRCSASADLL